jgi:hypothetical protein
MKIFHRKDAKDAKKSKGKYYEWGYETPDIKQQS